jgi:anthranilate synthase component 2
MPAVLVVNAHTAENEIMGVRHREHPIHGVQFHPESILTRHGKDLLKNFLQITTDFHAKKKAA